MSAVWGGVRSNWANGWTDPLLSPDGIHYSNQVTRSASTPGESMITVTGGKKRPTIKLKQAECWPLQLWVIKHSEFALHVRWKRLNLLSLRLTAKHFYTIRNKLLAFLLYNGLICRVQYSTCLTSLCLYSGLLTHKNRVWYTIHTFSHAVWRHANPRKGCNLAVTEWVKMYTYWRPKGLSSHTILESVSL